MNVTQATVSQVVKKKSCTSLNDKINIYEPAVIRSVNSDLHAYIKFCVS